MTSKPQFVGERQSLENRVEYVRGVTYKAAVDLHGELDENSYVLLRANNIQDGELIFDDVQYVDRSKVKPKQLLRYGDILFCASSGSKGLVGKAALVRETMPVTFGAFCCVLRPKGNEAEYLGHYFQSRQYRRAIEEVCSGSNINNLKAANFLSLVVPHYDGDSTRAISVLFDLIDAQVQQAKNQIKQLDSLVKSRFVEMFGDPVTAVSGVTLGVVANMKAGKTTTAKTIHDVYAPGLYPCYGGNGLRGYSAEPTHEGVFPLIGRQGALCGNVQIAHGIFRATEHAVIVDCKTSCEPVWLFHYLKYDDLGRLATGAAQPGLSVKDLKLVPVQLPSKDRQVDFISFAAQVDKSRFVDLGSERNEVLSILDVVAYIC
ncbi:restriction endonuclease subunit S domain-containing protein [Mobiluncus mulieris]|uniref:Restriction endonuclease subunit S n=1 Tax=Mobiluncus mulieris TaxID=2052 RepID=A0ABD4TZ19_9ACTO|nr:hypothetical protein [Mobiluncus mulieris]MCU9969649.1 hypothetical protein [Mobiluncus mulieris]MCU9973976.1 hypothetical protein [Mobiluncus mulieris]MCV0010174.1 hypothetical protein [Mobiluncus mulieris]NMW75815.1 hypothetical protein [Mobiluncus mulieris]NMX01980.1 hypothetical protein [Mobiluncus mulieris]